MTNVHETIHINIYDWKLTCQLSSGFFKNHISQESSSSSDTREIPSDLHSEPIHQILHTGNQEQSSQNPYQA